MFCLYLYVYIICLLLLICLLVVNEINSYVHMYNINNNFTLLLHKCYVVSVDNVFVCRYLLLKDTTQIGQVNEFFLSTYIHCFRHFT